MKDYWTVTRRERDKVLTSRLRGTASQDLLTDLRKALYLRPLDSPYAIAKRVLRAILPYTWIDDQFDIRTRCIRENDLAVVAMMLGDEKIEIETPEAHEGEKR